MTTARYSALNSSRITRTASSGSRYSRVGPLARFARTPARRHPAASSDAAAFCPAMTDRGTADDQNTMDAYQSIETELTKGSLARVSENAARIAEAFGEVNPGIAASARRLARARDIAAARREFQRLTDLFSRRSGESDGEPLLKPT